MNEGFWGNIAYLHSKHINPLIKDDERKKLHLAVEIASHSNVLTGIPADVLKFVRDLVVEVQKRKVPVKEFTPDTYYTWIKRGA